MPNIQKEQHVYTLLDLKLRIITDEEEKSRKKTISKLYQFDMVIQIAWTIKKQAESKKQQKVTREQKRKNKVRVGSNS